MSGEKEVTTEELKDLIENMGDEQIIVVNLEEMIDGEET